MLSFLLRYTILFIGLLCLVIGKSREQPWLWFAVGVVLFLIGITIIWKTANPSQKYGLAHSGTGLFEI